MDLEFCFLIYLLALIVPKAQTLTADLKLTTCRLLFTFNLYVKMFLFLALSAIQKLFMYGQK